MQLVPGPPTHPAGCRYRYLSELESRTRSRQEDLSLLTKDRAPATVDAKQYFKKVIKKLYMNTK